jgi:hypothetical protein
MSECWAIIAVGPIYLPPERQLPGAFVEHYDPDYNNGEGRAWFTMDAIKAKKFGSLVEAKAYSHRRSTKRPYFQNGTENRPILMEFRVIHRCLVPRAPDERLVAERFAVDLKHNRSPIPRPLPRRMPG